MFRCYPDSKLRWTHLVHRGPCRLHVPCYLGNMVNTLRPRQNGRHFAVDTFKRIFWNENVRISIKISLKFVPKGPINNNPALVQIMAWRWSGDKPLSEPMLVSLLTHTCVTRPHWVNVSFVGRCGGRIGCLSNPTLFKYEQLATPHSVPLLWFY